MEEDLTDLEIKIVSGHYLYYFHQDRDFCLNNIWDEYQISEGDQRVIIRKLENNSLIEPFTFDSFNITLTGVNYIENNKILNQKFIQENLNIRKGILLTLAEYKKENGPYLGMHPQELIQNISGDQDQIGWNIQYLKELNLIEDYNLIRITELGLMVANTYLENDRLVEEFLRVSNLTPNQRGLEFQKIIAGIIRGEGWSEQESLRTSNEEIDIIVHKEFTYFLIECKWEKSPIEANIVRELKGKLDNRIDVKGIIISMSGFTEGAIKQVKDYIGQVVILLFGEKDIHEIIDGEKDFSNILYKKYNLLSNYSGR